MTTEQRDVVSVRQDDGTWREYPLDEMIPEAQESIRRVRAILWRAGLRIVREQMEAEARAREVQAG